MEERATLSLNGTNASLPDSDQSKYFSTILINVLVAQTD